MTVEPEMYVGKTPTVTVTWPFAFGVSLMAWSGLRPSSSLGRRALGVTLGALVCLAPVLLFPGLNPG